MMRNMLFLAVFIVVAFVASEEGLDVALGMIVLLLAVFIFIAFWEFSGGE